MHPLPVDLILTTCLSRNGFFPLVTIVESHRLIVMFALIFDRCSHEYIDLYTEIPDAEPMDLIHSPFGGRYCGQIPPRRRVSLYRTAVLGFFSDKNSTDDILFQGSYLFFKDGKEYIL